MDTFLGSIRRGGPWRSRLIAVVAVIVLNCTVDAAFAAESTSSQSFLLHGSASLRLDQRAQQSGSFKLRASLASKDAAIAALPPVQEGSGLALMAKLLAKPTVCYNDTIFRDDYDGDGG